MDFSRKVGMRAIGENVTDVVENHLAQQTARGEFADPRYRSRTGRANPPGEPSDAARRDASPYHEDRFRMGREDYALKLRAAARLDGCQVKAFALMPDHVHLAFRGDVEQSPVELGVAFQNVLARAAGCRLWDYRFYVGTFSEYALKKILRPPALGRHG